ncbi:MAG: nucleotide exchange factor GrpE [Chlorobaculum sp.]
MTRKHHKEPEEIPETISTESAAEEMAAEIPAPTEADMEAEIAARDAEIQKLREEVMRRAADFENFRKQKEREAALSGTRMLENTVRDLLPLIDDLKRLMSHIPAELQEMAEAKPFVEGVELIRKNFMSLLERKGVKEIEAKGKVLDVNFHEAITQIDAPGAEPDTIVEEYQTGYTLGDRVIRHAKVIVAK